MPKVLITGSGSHVPSNGVSNGQLVQVFNDYVLRYNEENLPAIEAGQIPALEPTSCERIEQLSGIRHRYFVTRQGILDPEIMQPLLPTRADTRPVITSYSIHYTKLYEPHGAIAWDVMQSQLQDDEVGIFLCTAHPAKFKESVEEILVV